jgi:hypothetical protein
MGLPEAAAVRGSREASQVGRGSHRRPKARGRLRRAASSATIHSRAGASRTAVERSEAAARIHPSVAEGDLPPLADDETRIERRVDMTLNLGRRVVRAPT